MLTNDQSLFWEYYFIFHSEKKEEILFKIKYIQFV